MAEWCSAPTRPRPPFGAAQLQQMVTSPLWDPQLAAIPAADGQSSTDTPFGPDGIGAVFHRLVPAGYAKSGFAGADPVELGNTMVLTDAQGKGSVYADAMSGGPKSSFGLAAFRQDYPNAVQLSDGSWLGTKQVTGKGGVGTVQFWVAVLRGNRRIQLVALNSVGLNGRQTRSTPVLTIHQLTVMAESPTWGTAD